MSLSDEFDPIPITPPSGVVKGESDRVAEGRWIDMQWVRFRKGLPEKMGGWTRQTTSLSTGVLRALHAWRDLKNVEFIAGGTYSKLYVYERNFEQHDITPLAASGTLTDPFETVDGSTTVTVNHASHGRGVGDTVFFSNASAVGGITIDGEYQVTLVPGSGTFQIEHSSAATATAGPGGGSVDYEYEVSVGTERGAYGLGFGVGRYGLGTYGTARAFSTIFIEPRVWSLDHFGKILLAAFNGGSLYDWNPDNVGFPRAERVSNAPTDVRAMFITAERFVMLLCDGMRVDWCSQGNYTVFAPALGNTAGTRTLSLGTKLVAGVDLGNRISLIWSDFALYVFQYTGQSSVFSSRAAGRNCGLVSPSAAVTANGVAYWMGHANFHMYNGGVQAIPNVEDIRDYVFKNLRSEYGYLCWGQYLPKHNEIIWFYVAIGESEASYYVLLSLNDYSWASGQMERAAGTAFSHGDVRPYWSSEDGHIYLHENGVDGDGAAIEAFVKLAPSSIQKGRALLNIDGINMDLKDQVGDLTVEFEAWDRLRKPTIDSETQTVTEDDDLVDLRLSGRYVGMTIRSNAVGGFFRFGKPEVLVSSNGTRR